MIKLFFYFIVTIYSQEIFPPVHSEGNYPVDQYQLGQKLFFDKKLSRDNSTSCSSCHQVKNYGMDNKKFSLGSNFIETKVNTPSIFNLKFNSVFFIDGRVTSLSDAIKDELHNQRRLGTSSEELISKLSHDQVYVERFSQVYGKKISDELIVISIKAYVESLILTDSKFDSYLKGKVKMSESEMNGYKKFRSYGCYHCHNGINLGGNLFSRKGAFFSNKIEGPVKEIKYGRYNVTKSDEDKYVYKVPGLRNIEHTSPYLYFGQIEELSDVVRAKVHDHTGRVPSSKDINELMEFLKSLSTPNLGEKYVK